MHRLIWTVIGLMLLAPGARAEVGWMVYPYRIPVEDEQYQRLLNCEEAEYLGVQWYAQDAYDPQDLQKQRAGELTRAGKKVIVQLWFGSTPPFSWRYFNFPGIALNPKVRQDFFDKCTDPFIEHYGAQNMYALHLLEETGMQFSWDSDVPGYPEGQIGYGNSNNYDNPSSFEWPRGISGPYNLNVRKYNDFLRQETGLDMGLAPIWSYAEKARFNAWVQHRMEAGAHIEFAKHVHQKYPGLKVYAFNGVVPATAQAKVLDGQFTDPYTSTNWVYARMRRHRVVMRPDQDLVAMTWGNRDKPMHQRMPQQAACFLAGSDILSTYADREEKSDEWLNIVRDSVRPFLGRPRFEARPQVLCVGTEAQQSATLWNGVFWNTGFASYEMEAEGKPEQLDQYKLILAWLRGREDLESYVRKGGLLLGVNVGGDLLVREGLLEEPAEHKQITLDYQPDEWMRKNLHLRESYKLEVDHVYNYQVKNPARVHQDQFIYVAEYGKGLIVLLSAVCYVHPPWQYEAHWEVYRQLLADLGRGALLYRGEQQAAEESFTDPAQDSDYLKMTSSDGNLTVYVLLNDIHGPNQSRTSLVVKGQDQVTGKMDVTFGEEHPVVIIEHE